MKKDGFQSGQRSFTGILRILIVVTMGIGLYLLLNHTPLLIMMFPVNTAMVNIHNPTKAVAEEIEYRDRNGNRINGSTYAVLKGYENARERSIVAHADCKASFPSLERFGCDQYVTEQKHFPVYIQQRDWGSGKTSAQCEIEVNAYWEPRIQDMREMGQYHAAASWTRRYWMRDLEQCRGYDNVRIGEAVHKPASRLWDILKKVEEGGAITDADRETVRKDLARVMNFPDGGDGRFKKYKQDYLAKSEYFFQLADGKIKPPENIPLKLSCPELQARFDSLAKSEQEDIAALKQLQLKQADDLVDPAQTEARHRIYRDRRRAGLDPYYTDDIVARKNALNQSRIDRLWDLDRYTKAALATGCNITGEYGEFVKQGGFARFTRRFIQP
jgi:hypothetical protein